MKQINRIFCKSVRPTLFKIICLKQTAILEACHIKIPEIYSIDIFCLPNNKIATADICK